MLNSVVNNSKCCIDHKFCVVMRKIAFSVPSCDTCDCCYCFSFFVFTGFEPQDRTSRQGYPELGSGEAGSGDQQGLFESGGSKEEDPEASGSTGSGADLFSAERFSDDAQTASPWQGTEGSGDGSRRDEGRSKHWRLNLPQSVS